MSEEFFRPQNPNQRSAEQQVNNFPPHIPLDSQPAAGVQIGGNVPPELAAILGSRSTVPAQNISQHIPPQQFPSQQFPPQFTNNENAPKVNRSAHAEPVLPVDNPYKNVSVQSSNPNFTAILQALKAHNETYEEVILPSLGRFYNGEDGPTNGIIHVKPMTGVEEQVLATQRLINNGTAINMIFSKCMQENFKPENLLVADRTFLLIYLRGISYGTEYEIEIKDPDSDSGKFSEVIDLDSLTVERCPDNFGVHSLRGVMPKSGLNFTYRLARGKDEVEIQAHKDKNKKAGKDLDDSLLFRTALLIESIENITNKTEILTLVKNLSVQDLTYIRNLTNEPPFGVNTKIVVLSPRTNDEFEIELPLEANFFFPRNLKKESPPA